MNKDFLFDTEKNLLNFLKEESESSLFAEICSLVGISKDKKFVYRNMKNRSKNPEFQFVVDPYDFLNFIKGHEVLLIFHSHLAGDERPSDFDIKTSENCCFPFMIYSIMSEKFFIYEPQLKSYDVNLIKRLKELL